MYLIHIHKSCVKMVLFIPARLFCLKSHLHANVPIFFLFFHYYRCLFSYILTIMTHLYNARNSVAVKGRLSTYNSSNWPFGAFRSVNSVYSWFEFQNLIVIELGWFECQNFIVGLTKGSFNVACLLRYQVICNFSTLIPYQLILCRNLTVYFLGWLLNLSGWLFPGRLGLYHSFYRYLRWKRKK